MGWDDQFLAPVQIKKHIANQQIYGDFMDVSKKLINTIQNSPNCIQEATTKMNELIKLAEMVNHDEAMHTIHPLDPIPTPTQGHKRSSRIKSSTEKSNTKHVKFESMNGKYNHEK